MPGSTPAADDEPARGERRQRFLEAAEVAGEQQRDRSPGGPFPAHPPPQHGRARRLLRLSQQREQDRQLGPVVQIARDDLERVGVEDGQELVVVEPQQLLEARRAQKS